MADVHRIPFMDLSNQNSPFQNSPRSKNGKSLKSPAFLKFATSPRGVSVVLAAKSPTPGSSPSVRLRLKEAGEEPHACQDPVADASQNGNAGVLDVVSPMIKTVQKSPLLLGTQSQDVSLGDIFSSPVPVARGATAGANDGVHHRDENGFTPLHWASFNRNHEEVESTVKALGDELARTWIVDQNNIGGQSVAHLAAFQGDVRVLVTCLQLCPELLNRQDVEGSTLLSYAVTQNHEECVKKIVSMTALRGAGVSKLEVLDAKDHQGRTPLLIAAYMGFTKIASILLNAGASKDLVDGEGNTPLLVAAEIGNIELVETLLSRKADPTAVNHRGRTFLHIAVHAGNFDLVCAAIAKLQELESKGRLSQGTLLALMNAQDFPKRSTCLHFCACKGDLNIAQILLSSGADVNMTDEVGSSALMYACLLGHQEVASLLLDNHADVQIKTVNRCTPFLLSAVNGNVDLAKTLRERGANPNDFDEKGRTALMECVRKGHALFAHYLLDPENGIGTDVNANDVVGMTALHYAALAGSVECTYLLIQHGATIDPVDDLNETPMIKACSSGHTEVIRLLQDAGAQTERVSDYIRRLAVAISSVRDMTISRSPLIHLSESLMATNKNRNSPLKQMLIAGQKAETPSRSPVPVNVERQLHFEEPEVRAPLSWSPADDNVLQENGGAKPVIESPELDLEDLDEKPAEYETAPLLSFVDLSLVDSAADQTNPAEDTKEEAEEQQILSPAVRNMRFGLISPSAAVFRTISSPAVLENCVQTVQNFVALQRETVEQLMQVSETQSLVLAKELLNMKRVLLASREQRAQLTAQFQLRKDPFNYAIAVLTVCAGVIVAILYSTTF
eukprot:ANDGO_00632.mRNA.1 Ankyrin repeat and KH domain-containing protein mask